MSAEKYFAENLILVEEYLDKIMPLDKGISDIDEAMRYSLMAGGKRLRPMLVMAAAEAVGVAGKNFLPVACGLEMIHTYSLVHDDLPAMDDDDYRRGRLTNHKVFGEAKAILAGDALLTKAFEVMLSQEGVEPSILLDVVRRIAVCAGSNGMVGGQVIDLEAENNAISFERLQTMHMAKTGALFKAALFAGARLAGATEKQVVALSEYATNFGLAFQITDDILDVEGDSKEMGKTAGSDVRKEKSTYVSVHTLDGAKNLAKEHVEKAIMSLQIFGSKAENLKWLGQELIQRKK